MEPKASIPIREYAILPSCIQIEQKMNLGDQPTRIEPVVGLDLEVDEVGRLRDRRPSKRSQSEEGQSNRREQFEAWHLDVRATTDSGAGTRACLVGAAEAR